MRISFLLITTVMVAVGLSGPSGAAPPSAVAAASKAEASRSGTIEPACSGCGCRGGPGYRLSNGRCASWGRRR